MTYIPSIIERRLNESGKFKGREWVVKAIIYNMQNHPFCSISAADIFEFNKMLDKGDYGGFLLCAFDWQATTEGDLFWEKEYKQLIK